MAPPYTVPEVPLNSVNRKMPVLGLGTASSPVPPPEVIVRAVLDAMELGYRHFDTAALYGSEGPLGEAISQALGLGLIKSRDELFITSKLWCNDAHADRVLPALQKSLKNLNLEYIDQYLIHWPISMTPGPFKIPPGPEDLLPLDIKGVWTAMEECQKLGLTKTIGVSNFTCKKLGDLLALAKIPPAVNQVEMNPTWQQKKLIEYCKGNGVVVAIYSPLGAAGAFWGTNGVLESEILKEIAEAKGKSVAQVALRWAYEQGVVVIMKSYNKERLKQNIEIFDWELSEENLSKIAEIPQARANLGQLLASPTGPFKSVEDLWDGEL